MCWGIGVEARVLLQIKEESLPLPTKPMRDVKPKTLNARVVYAPVTGCLRESAQGERVLTSPRYKTHGSRGGWFPSIPRL